MMILKTVVGDALAAQDFEQESLAKPALVGEHSQVGKAPTSASDSCSKDCADRASPAAVFRIVHFVPHFRITPKIKKLLASIEKLQHASKSHTRARERHYFEKIEEISSDKHELDAYMRAYDQMVAWAKAGTPLTEDLIKTLHALVLGKSGKSAYRRGQNAVFDPTKTEILYLPPHARYVKSLMQELVAWLESSQYPAPITASVCHIGFNTIHPYYDGNGRTARLLTKFILLKAGYKMTLLEEYYYKDLDAYYKALDTKRSLTSWIAYFCEGMLSTLLSCKYQNKQSSMQR